MDGLSLARSCARKSIVHTMLKNSEISTSSPSRTHRTYSAQFKAARMVHHARQWVLGLGANDAAFAVFKRHWRQLDAV